MAPGGRASRRVPVSTWHGTQPQVGRSGTVLARLSGPHPGAMGDTWLWWPGHCSAGKPPGGWGHIPPHPAQPQHTNDWAPRTRKQHQQEHRPQRPTEPATRRSMRREERVTVQGPVKRQQPDGMSHGGGVGGSEAPKVYCTSNRPQISSPFDKFHFVPEEDCSDVGGWVGRLWPVRAPNNPNNPNNAPPLGSLSNGLLGARLAGVRIIAIARAKHKGPRTNTS